MTTIKVSSTPSTMRRNSLMDCCVYVVTSRDDLRYREHCLRFRAIEEAPSTTTNSRRRRLPFFFSIPLPRYAPEKVGSILTASVVSRSIR